MKIICDTTFLDGRDRFEKDDQRTVDDERGAYFIANGWAHEAGAAVDLADVDVVGEQHVEAHPGEPGDHHHLAQRPRRDTREVLEQLDNVVLDDVTSLVGRGDDSGGCHACSARTRWGVVGLRACSTVAIEAPSLRDGPGRCRSRYRTLAQPFLRRRL